MNLKSPKDTAITISELMLPSYSNFSGKIHGGYILNLMDQIAFACASKYSGKYCVTASINTVDFLNPIEVGELVTLKAMINYVGNTSMVVGIRVESENIQTGEVKHCNSSYFLMVAKEENGHTSKVSPIKLESKEDVRRFLRAAHRLDSKRKRKIEFSKDEKLPENFENALAHFNCVYEEK
ncbi:acyl-CoA thioesterase [Aureivirga marina]|uniref:acyl-CoA thioesterase n=1 Tax=Aureivirga marina TaxID=1182451 RepID=UPI0018CA6D27|nr:acyl-CoA thioesterase [Aureivirga marina]